MDTLTPTPTPTPAPAPLPTLQIHGSRALAVPVLLALHAAMLAGCAATPESIIERPLSTVPKPHMPVASTNGAIFQSNYYRPMFEDRRARLPGDLVTIIINERNVAGKTQAGSGSKTGSASASIPVVPLIGPGLASRLGAAASNAVNHEDKGAASNSNNFASTIGVTVIDVLSNGNLVVAGEKQIAMDKGAEYIRFSGVINPVSISAANTVSSLQVADARVEYRSSARFDVADALSHFSRFFLSVLPF